MKTKAKKKMPKNKKLKKPRAPKPAPGPVNVITDRRGTTFDPALHAATPEGTPHTDSMGHFILKSQHYDGAKKAHFADSFRHA